jgi:hypothetical protein
MAFPREEEMSSSLLTLLAEDTDEPLERADGETMALGGIFGSGVSVTLAI